MASEPILSGFAYDRTEVWLMDGANCAYNGSNDPTDRNFTFDVSGFYENIDKLI